MDPEGFLRQAFRKYYDSSVVQGPPGIEQREFGVGSFGKKISARHLSFPSASELNSYLRKTTPFYISYSPAYYRFPGRTPMKAKELEKADLVYEFDADDLVTDCKEKHDSWGCECGASGKGAIKNCTKCGKGVRVEEWVCDECLGETKKQVFRLVEILENDLGISSGISLNFSGSKGYHLHVRSASVSGLSARARVELVDYLTLNGFEPRLRGFYLDPATKKMHCPILENASGWNKRIMDGLAGLFRSGDAERVGVAGNISFRKSKELITESDTILDGMSRGTLFQLPGRKTEAFWNSAINHVAEELALGIDRQTSVDIAKIVRLPDTIHGGTGLLAKSLSLNALKGFSPLKDSVVLEKEAVKVSVASAPKFSLAGQSFGPFTDSVEELPGYASAYLVARGAADLAE